MLKESKGRKKHTALTSREKIIVKKDMNMDN